MKLIYSELKKIIPGLNVEPQKLRDDLTLIGHFTNYYEEIAGEIVFDLDIKVNRGDCLGYYGLARDLAVYYNLPLADLPPLLKSQNNSPLKIQVKTPNVTRVMAVKLSGLKNSVSPDWLQKFLKLHGVNSINTIVDLTNYIMFRYGLPNHAFDLKKSGEDLIWEMNPGYPEFTSLDGTKLPVNEKILMINNSTQPLSLSFWGGESCAIDQNTTEIIIEVAVYNRTVVRQNSRQLKSVTEASIRLEKDLDPELIPQALSHLAQLLIDNCQAKIDSDIFDHYPQRILPSPIDFEPSLPGQISGIEIPAEFTKDVLSRLGCIDFIPPSIRKDLTLPEDLAEEVIRFWGYDKIPTNQPIAVKNTPDITPKIIYLVDSLKDKLIDLGYDEVLSWPLVQKPQSPNAVFTQNSINSEYPVLRESIIQSLHSQLDQYLRYKLPRPQFFEIGKIYGQQDGQYIEKYSLGIYHYDASRLAADLAALGLKAAGDNFAEIILDDLEKPDVYLPRTVDNHAIELTSQIITLDANVTLDGPQDSQNLIAKYSALISQDILWSMEIIDIYQNRYTFRVCYYNCSDKAAKSVHLSTFNLI